MVQILVLEGVSVGYGCGASLVGSPRLLSHNLNDFSDSISVINDDEPDLVDAVIGVIVDLGLDVVKQRVGEDEIYREEG